MKPVRVILTIYPDKSLPVSFQEFPHPEKVGFEIADTTQYAAKWLEAEREYWRSLGKEEVVRGLIRGIDNLNNLN